MSTEVNEQEVGTRQVLEYQVSPNGEVRAVMVKNVQGQTYEIKQRRVGTQLPLTVAKRLRMNKWTAFQKTVIKQEVGIWYTYGPFADNHELKLAKGSLSRTDGGAFVGFAPKKVQVVEDAEHLELNVLISEPEAK